MLRWKLAFVFKSLFEVSPKSHEVPLTQALIHRRYHFGREMHDYNCIIFILFFLCRFFEEGSFLTVQVVTGGLDQHLTRACLDIDQVEGLAA